MLTESAALASPLSPIWLRHYRFGPLEWCWRSQTYWTRQPMRRAAMDKVLAC
jgi:uncharacterized membrane protein YeiB